MEARLASSELNALPRKKKTYLGSLLATASLALGVGQGGGLLSGLSRGLSLRKKISVLFTYCCIFFEL